MQANIVSRARFVGILLSTSSIAGVAQAQNVPAPPVQQSVDANGVDVALGTFNVTSLDLQIGPAPEQGLSYTREWRGAGWRDNMVAAIDGNASKVIVSIGGSSDSFTLAGGVYTSDLANGATLTLATNYTYTSADGTVAVFTPLNGGQYSDLVASLGYVSYVQYTNGNRLTFSNKVKSYCTVDYDPGQHCPSGKSGYAVRRISVQNSYGYELYFAYKSNVLTMQGELFDWSLLAKVTGLNNAIELCSGDTCTPTNPWPTSTYTWNATSTELSVQDPRGSLTRYTRDLAGTTFKIKRPTASTDSTVVTFDAAYKVATLVNEGVTWNYSFADAGSTRTMVMTGPLSTKRTVVSDVATNLVQSDTDALNRITSYLYDPNSRVIRITNPEGNYVHYLDSGGNPTYDSRGNIKLQTTVAKAGTGLSDITTTAGFPGTCTNTATCNKPMWTKDALQRETDYTYDNVTGLVTSVTGPAVNGVRPQTRYIYSSQQAWLSNGASWAASGQPVWVLTGTSTCATQAGAPISGTAGVGPFALNGSAACVGTSDEIKTAIVYEAGSASTKSNLLPVSATTASGNTTGTGAVSATSSMAYDMFSNATSIDGPLAGNADTTRLRYNANRKLVGIVGPDPDASGLLKPRARRIGYDADGQVTKIEQGTVVNPTDDPATALIVLRTVDTTYDANARKVKDALSAAGTPTPYAVMQYSYDATGRPQCTAQRMNPATYGSLPSWACSIETGSAVNVTYGPDRITSPTYDAASQVTSATSAVGVTTANGFAVQQERTEATYTYTVNGKLASVADGKGNLTSYAYDGFDRPFRTCFLTAVTACPTSTGDYEQLTYDAASNVTTRRLRDSTSLTYVLDNLNRVTDVQMPVATPTNNNYPPHYTYDNLGRLTLATDNGGLTITPSYDALGRKIGEGSVFGQRTLAYDAAGRRTKLAWPDGFYVTYDYFTTGELKTIYENGTTALASFGYDDLGRRTALIRGNGTASQYGYDGASRLNAMNLLLPAGGGTYSTDNAYTLAYSPAGQITSRTSSNDAYAWTGHYNVSRSYTSNGLNRYSQISSTATIVPTYDGRGNLTSAGSTAWVYNAFNRLTDIYGFGYFFYDATGRMNYSYPEQKWFDYDGDQMISEYSNGTGYPMTRRTVFVPGGDEPVLWYDGAGTGTKHYLAADERGSIVQVTNGTGMVEHRNAYDEYGIPQAGNLGRFQYTGQAWLPDLNMYNYKARLYSPTLGRFMQTDPIDYADGLNWHAYVGNDPVNATDPSGMTCYASPAAKLPQEGVTVLPGGTMCPETSETPETRQDPEILVQRRKDPVRLEAPDLSSTINRVNLPATANVDFRNDGAQQNVNDGSILQQKGRRNGTGKRGEAGKNPNEDKHGPKKAYGKPGYVTDEGRDGQRGRPRLARPGEPGYGEGGSNFSVSDTLVGAGVVVFVGGAAILLAPEVAAALAAAGVVSLFAN